MPRNQPSRQPSNGSVQLPPEYGGADDREPERGPGRGSGYGDERAGNTDKLRDGFDDDDDDGAYGDYGDYRGYVVNDREYHVEHRLSNRDHRRSTQAEDGPDDIPDDVDDELEHDVDLEEADIMEVLDQDDLSHMDGPDA